MLRLLGRHGEAADLLEKTAANLAPDAHEARARTTGALLATCLEAAERPRPALVEDAGAVPEADPALQARLLALRALASGRDGTPDGGRAELVRRAARLADGLGDEPARRSWTPSTGWPAPKRAGQGHHGARAAGARTRPRPCATGCATSYPSWPSRRAASCWSGGTRPPPCCTPTTPGAPPTASGAGSRPTRPVGSARGSTVPVPSARRAPDAGKGSAETAAEPGPGPDPVPVPDPENRPADPSTGLDRLSEREREISVLVSKGRTNQQIARALALSPKTVETYLARVFKKLALCSRAQLAALVGMEGRLTG
ncbi:LuxR C-terminal-related transcriptional regulator [Streptomyces tricolor]|nr:LuxR C-terminal-related transcriptional regulator [Streptomyces tricolor]